MRKNNLSLEVYFTYLLFKARLMTLQLKPSKKNSLISQPLGAAQLSAIGNGELPINTKNSDGQQNNFLHQLLSGEEVKHIGKSS
jgi:hypothetical protein